MFSLMNIHWLNYLSKYRIQKLRRLNVIIERESPKTIKITGTGKIPFDMFVWIQILPLSEYQSKIRVTLHADLNMMMKMVAGKKMSEGVNKIAEALAHLPYR